MSALLAVLAMLGPLFLFPLVGWIVDRAPADQAERLIAALERELYRSSVSDRP